MPTAAEIQREKDKLYETAGIRDDLNDDEATVLLAWAETRIETLATQPDSDFEQQTRFMRQLLARLDRFIGQRQYMDDVAHADGIASIMKALPMTGFTDISESALLACLPSDRADMRANLDAILQLLTPVDVALIATQPPASNIPATPASSASGAAGGFSRFLTGLLRPSTPDDTQD